MSKRLRIALGVLVLVAATVLALALANPYIPATYGFRSDDPISQARYEEIVKAHGYEIRYEKNIRGETMAMIDGISPREYKTIDCEFDAWSTQHARANGIIAYDRDDCAL